MRVLDKVLRTITIWWTVIMMMIVVEVTSLSGPHVCMVKQKYNVTKRVKYRAPMSVRTYEWCFAMPPRCSKWSTEMKDLTRLETEERTADTAVCCPGYKMKDISCIPICPHGKTGAGCLDDCPPNKWGPNCVNDCKTCIQGTCLPTTGECQCQPGRQGERCEIGLSTTPGAMMESLTTAKASTTTKPTTLPTTPLSFTTSSPNSTTRSPITSTSAITTTPASVTTKLVPFSAETSKMRAINYPSTDSKQVIVYINQSLTTSLPKERQFTTETTIERNSVYNRTETWFENTPSVNTFVTPVANETAKTTTTTSTEATDKTSNEILSTRTLWTTEPIKTPIEMNTSKETTKAETKRSETTVKPLTTAKFKPKEIWIRPAQKGDHSFETKLKLNLNNRAKIRELSTEMTTPKTIVVSIIPTSVSYATFKRIFLTTASYMTQKKSSSTELVVNEHTMAMTTVPPTTHLASTIKNRQRKPYLTSISSSDATRTRNLSTKMSLNETKSTQIRLTNSMAMNSTEKLSPTHSLTTISSTNEHSTVKQNFPILSQVTTSPTSKIMTSPLITAQTASTEHYSITKQLETVEKNASDFLVIDEFEQNGSTKRNLTKSNFNDTAETTKKYEETFPILTEPEHITAVMSDKGNERSSVDLISVISIAGGVMMAMITVAVIIVMIERCKKPRYEDDRKYNEIRMQVMVDDNNINDSPPPPYVRSIFHTPLPDPPTLEKCHYQPISTLDRNLKQFMRPVVVQTISPLMLENFRGILECHYDHLPRRSHDSMQMRCSASPSIDECSTLLPKRALSLTDSTIEAMKCEATFDILDSTTSEPLYAEIPCWRPPSEHAVEIVNLNGESVTEL